MRFTEDEYKQWFNGQPRKPVSGAVLFVNESQEVLLLKPTYRDDWNLPGGVLEEHESPLDGAVRETKEELDLTINRTDLQLSSVDYRPAKNGLVDKLYFYFYGGALSEEAIQSISLQAEEVEEMRFVSLEEAKQLLSKWTYSQVSISLSSTNRAGLYLENGQLPGEATL